MTFYHRTSNRKRIFHNYTGEEEEENVSSFRSSDGQPITVKNLHEHEKRVRREIANSNERRRMQNINAGLMSLKSLLPHRGEKLSKVAILQSAAEYVYQLEQDKERLMKQNSRMSQNVTDSPNTNHDSDCSSDAPEPERKHSKTVDLGDEGIISSSSFRSDNFDDYKQEVQELRIELKRERTLRLLLEEQIRNLESRLTQLKKKPNCVEEMVQGSVLVMNYGHESGISSPQSQNSSQDTESAREMSQRESSPDLSGSEIMENPLQKSIIPSEKQSIRAMNNIPGLLMPTSPISSSCPEIPQQPVRAPQGLGSGQSPVVVTPQQAVYNISRSRQNLATIVEAIKHVEGLNVFHSDLNLTQ